LDRQLLHLTPSLGVIPYEYADEPSITKKLDALSSEERVIHPTVVKP